MKLINRALINVRNESEMEELLREYAKHGIKWASGRKLSEFNPYYIHRENTCIVLHENRITYESIYSYRVINRDLILFSDIK